METNCAHLVFYPFHFGDWGGLQPFSYYLQSLLRIPLRIFTCFACPTPSIYDFLFLGGSRRKFLTLDFLASFTWALINGQKPNLGRSGDDCFCLGTNVFNVHDSRRHYSGHRLKNRLISFLTIAGSTTWFTCLEHAAKLYSQRWSRLKSIIAELLDGYTSAYFIFRLRHDLNSFCLFDRWALEKQINRMD